MQWFPIRARSGTGRRKWWESSQRYSSGGMTNMGSEGMQDVQATASLQDPDKKRAARARSSVLKVGV